MVFPNTTFVSKVTTISRSWLQAVNDFVNGIPEPATGPNLFLQSNGSSYVLADPTGTTDPPGSFWVFATKYMSAAQLAGVRGSGPLVAVDDEVDLAIADCGDIGWNGSIAAQLPSAGGMIAGGAVVFPPGVYMHLRTHYIPAHVKLVGQGGGGFFNPRANDAAVYDGNVSNVKQALILANFPAGSGVGQAGQMWVFESANWTAAGARIGYRNFFSGSQIDIGSVSIVPGVAIEGLCIDSVRDPATGIHIAAQIPYGAIKMVGALNARINNVAFAGCDYGIIANAMWGYQISNVFGYAYLGGLLCLDNNNAALCSQIYINRDETLDATAPRTVSAGNRPDIIQATGQLGVASGFPEDFTNMRFGALALYPQGLHWNTSTHEGWDIPFACCQAPAGGFVMTGCYSERTRITPLACVSTIGTINSLFDFSPGSRYGFCWGLNNSLQISGTMPRRMHCRSATEDPNRNIQIVCGKPDLYLNAGGGRSANMLSYSMDPGTGTTLTNMTAVPYTATAFDGSFTASTLTAPAGAISSCVKAGGAQVAPIGGIVVDLVNYPSASYCHWADLKYGPAGTPSAKAMLTMAFSGGAGGTGTAKCEIDWSVAGVPTLTITGTGATGFAELLGDGWYRINIAGDRGTHTAATVSVYIGTDTIAAVAGRTMLMGEHELNPTAFPLMPIYNAGATIPRAGVWNGVDRGAEHWEWRDGISYIGDTQSKIRVSENGNPFALGMDTGNTTTGTATTFDAALKRVSLDTRFAWEITIVDGETVQQTANNTSLLFKNPDFFLTKTGGGADPTVNVRATPSGAVSHLPVEGKFDIQVVDVNITLPTSTDGLTDANLAGWIYFRGNRGAAGHLHIGPSTIDLGDRAALFQQGFNTVNWISLSLGNGATLTGTTTGSGGTSRIHSAEATAGNSETKYVHTQQGATLTNIVNTINVRGWDGTVTAVSTT